MWRRDPSLMIKNVTTLRPPSLRTLDVSLRYWQAASGSRWVRTDVVNQREPVVLIREAVRRSFEQALRNVLLVVNISVDEFKIRMGTRDPSVAPVNADLHCIKPVIMSMTIQEFREMQHPTPQPISSTRSSGLASAISHTFSKWRRPRILNLSPPTKFRN
jgi:hypothetical protein